jgi:hypothetical protein
MNTETFLGHHQKVFSEYVPYHTCKIPFGARVELEHPPKCSKAIIATLLPLPLQARGNNI